MVDAALGKSAIMRTTATHQKQMICSRCSSQTRTTNECQYEVFFEVLPPTSSALTFHEEDECTILARILNPLLHTTTIRKADSSNRGLQTGTAVCTCNSSTRVLSVEVSVQWVQEEPSCFLGGVCCERGKVIVGTFPLSRLFRLYVPFFRHAVGSGAVRAGHRKRKRKESWLPRFISCLLGGGLTTTMFRSMDSCLPPKGDRVSLRRPLRQLSLGQDPLPASPLISNQNLIPGLSESVVQLDILGKGEFWGALPAPFWRDLPRRRCGL